MFRSISRAKPLLILWSSLLLAILNAYSAQIPLLGVLALIGFLVGASSILGPILLPKQTIHLQIAAGFLGVISVLTLAGSVLYYITSLSPALFAILLLIFSGVLSISGRNALTRNASERHLAFIPPIVTIAMCASIICLATWFWVISQIHITDSVRTPWDFVLPTTLIVLGTSLAFLITIFHKNRALTIALPLFAVTLFASISMAAFIYPHGFGFDPFIHRTTVEHIAEFGSISPKPFYYIGQYSLELIAHEVFSLPIKMLDPFLLPVLATLMLIASMIVGLTRTLKEHALLGLTSVFLLPLSAFIITTPQSLAYVFTASLLFLSLPILLAKEHVPSKWLLLILALSAFITHPLAGIPALIYFALFFITTTETGYPILKKSVTIIAGIFGAVSLPLVFILQAHYSNLSILITPKNLLDVSFFNFTHFFTNTYEPGLDFLYLVIDNMFWIILLLAGIGTFFAIKHKASKRLHLPLLMALILFINYWILATMLEFDFLIEYERANYSDRLLFLIALFLLPAVSFAIVGIHQTMQKRSALLHGSWIIFLCAIATANIYGAYPRHDGHARSAGYNVSTSDYDAVYAINAQGKTESYIVLANQAVSSAALEEFGFTTYYNNDMFYYPIPTGGILYEKYLEMTQEEPTRELAISAMDLADVNLLFFVVNDYWWQSDKIKEHAKLQADDWFGVGNGAVTVFIYRR